ncbi:MAG: 16S rRNA (cytidine(1402)-2'-O)-methyltransferase [Erythrobacter sp.]
MNNKRPESCPPEPFAAGLYIVATPIGNLGDITLRAVDILQGCELVACEDTRVTGKLLSHLGISKPMQRYDDHSSAEQRARIIAQAQSHPVALVSDAGTPMVSDPGFRLVAGAREAGVMVTTIPGPSAAIAALTLAGLPNDRFLFGGFLPVKEKARHDVLRELSQVDATLIFYETGPRLLKSLAAIAQDFPARQVVVAREITKLHEESRGGTAEELIAHYSSHPAKGEIVLLLGPSSKEEESFDPEAMLQDALVDLSPAKAAGMVAKATGLDRKKLYTRAIELKAQ